MLTFLEKEALELIEGVLAGLSQSQNDVAIYVNPFSNWNATENPVSGVNRRGAVSYADSETRTDGLIEEHHSG